jgi:amino acid transporter
MLFSRTRALGGLGVFFGIVTILTIGAVIGAGAGHFDPALLRVTGATSGSGGAPLGRSPIDLPFGLDASFAVGLGGAMTLAVYDYLGYYNICHLGDEVRNPGRNIPYSIVVSILLVAALYMSMNVSILGVVPWQEAMKSSNVAALFMERLYGRPAAVALTILVLATVVACCFAMTLGYSRIPYAAAKAGDFFPIFARIHPSKHFPYVSLAALGAITAASCFFTLQDVVGSAVVLRIGIVFIAQIVALDRLRRTPGVRLPFRMRLYPLPSLIALIGWCYLLATSPMEQLVLAGGVLVTGVIAFAVWRGCDHLLSRRGAPTLKEPS